MDKKKIPILDDSKGKGHKNDLTFQMYKIMEVFSLVIITIAGNGHNTSRNRVCMVKEHKLRVNPIPNPPVGHSVFLMLLYMKVLIYRVLLHHSCSRSLPCCYPNRSF